MINRAGMMNNRLAFGDTKRVLLVEDEKTISNLERQILDMCAEDGDTIEIIEPGEDKPNNPYKKTQVYEGAMQELESGQNFDLLLTDGHLESAKDIGKGDGILVAQAAHKKDIPIVMCSSDPNLEPPVVAMGGKFLMKPARMRLLKQAAAEKLYPDHKQGAKQ